MRLLFVADGRSPIALNWMRFFVEAGHEVHLASTFVAQPDLSLASFHLVPVAFSGVKAGVQAPQSRKTGKGVWSASLVGLRTSLRQWLGPFTLVKAARRLREIVDRVQPDLIHAMRIPFEGMLAGLCAQLSGTNAVDPPLLISVWGNDFTLHAPSTPWMRSYTRLALEYASAMHTDCRRDVRLAQAWGFPAERPWIVLPGGGGIQLDIFHPQENPDNPWREDKPEPGALVVNPRGVRSYVRSDTFFQSIPAVLARLPATRFACPAMAGDPHALHWLQSLGIAGSVDLLPQIPRSQMADLFRRAQVVVSPSTHDGTPNTVLEAMACGCLPIAGDLESIREWITPGVNGLLVDPGDPHALAEAVLLALEQPAWRKRAAHLNGELIVQRAEYRKVMGEAVNFYNKLLGSSSSA